MATDTSLSTTPQVDVDQPEYPRSPKTKAQDVIPELLPNDVSSSSAIRAEATVETMSASKQNISATKPALGKHARKKLKKAIEVNDLARAEQILGIPQETATSSTTDSSREVPSSTASSSEPRSASSEPPQMAIPTTKSAQKTERSSRPAKKAALATRLRALKATSQEREEAKKPNTAPLTITRVPKLKLTRPKPPTKPIPPSQKTPKPREPWQTQKHALATKLAGANWTPNRRLSPDAIDGIRTLHAQYPTQFTTPVLAAHFKMSPDAIRRILKGKWTPSAEEDEARRARWERRGTRIWSRLAEEGVNPPAVWREKGAGMGMERREIEKGEVGRRVRREEFGSEAEKRLKEIMAEIPDMR